MKTEKLTYHFELSPSQNFQKATVGLTVDCILEDGDDPDEVLAKLKSDVRHEVGNEALKALDILVRNAANKRRDI